MVIGVRTETAPYLLDRSEGETDQGRPQDDRQRHRMSAVAADTSATRGLRHLSSARKRSTGTVYSGFRAASGPFSATS